jgi:hypothetical protein
LSPSDNDSSSHFKGEIILQGATVSIFAKTQIHIILGGIKQNTIFLKASDSEQVEQPRSLSLSLIDKSALVFSIFCHFFSVSVFQLYFQFFHFHFFISLLCFIFLGLSVLALRSIQLKSEDNALRCDFKKKNSWRRLSVCNRIVGASEIKSFDSISGCRQARRSQSKNVKIRSNF